MNIIFIMIVSIFIAVAGLVTFGYTLSKCGMNTFLLGNGAFYTAVTGLCDK